MNETSIFMIVPVADYGQFLNKVTKCTLKFSIIRNLSRNTRPLSEMRISFGMSQGRLQLLPLLL